ncbi:MAG: PspC domain-containing protein [Limosilactobacillus sp.]|uniref:PspC domain-containing protein n=1 Tax=Limosilactobacillus sp. TaxID=2773925 RepID=UPI0026F9104E|nr:PspC domain-containing protein [Limosilactobacillus sp.]
MKQPLKKSKNKVISGVCAGIAENIDWDPTIVRVLAVILLFVTGLFPIAVIYIVMAIIMPEDDGKRSGDTLEGEFKEK